MDAGRAPLGTGRSCRFPGRVPPRHTPGTVTFTILAASALQAYLDGPRLLDGPVRYARAHPRHQRVTADLAAGDHVLAVHLRNYGLATRVMPDVPAFWWCRAWPAATSEQKLAVGWRCRRITEHRGTGLRISPLLEWVEWTDEFLHPAWREVGYDDSSWPAPAAVPVTALPAARSVPASVQLPTWPARKVKPAAVGVYRDTYTGYEPDDLSIQIALSDLAPRPGQDIDGVWQRYDLGRVRIGALELDVWTAAGGAGRSHTARS